MRLTNYYVNYQSSLGNYYLLNTLRGTVHNVSEKLYFDFEKLKENLENKVLDTSYSFFVKNNFLVNETKEKIYIERIKTQSSIDYGKHITIFFYLTYNCNLKCSYCNYKSISSFSYKDMSESQIVDAFKKIVDIIGQDNNLSLTIVLFGGEPLLVKNQKIAVFFKEYIKLKDEYNISLKLLIFSNGVELPNFIEFHGEYLPLISGLYITIAGNKETHNNLRPVVKGVGSFEATIRGINMSIEYSIPTWVIFNVSAQNIYQLKYVSNIIKKYNWTLNKNFLGCCVSRIKSRGNRDVETYSEFELLSYVIDSLKKGDIDLSLFNFEDMRILKNVLSFFNYSNKKTERTFLQFNGCGNRFSQYSFTPEGLIYPCSPSIGDSNLSIGKYGNSGWLINQNEKWTNQDVEKNSECLQCSMAFICGGGCAYSRIKDLPMKFKSECYKIRQLIPLFIECIENKILPPFTDFVYEE